MQVPPEPILTEERLNDLASIFADCIKELYADKLPNPKFIVYMRTPRSDDQGNESSAFMYSVSCGDSVDEETLDTCINSLEPALKQCFLDKLSSNKNRDPDREWVGYYGRVLSLKVEPRPVGNKPIGDLSLDESHWIEVIKFAEKKKWYSKIEIIGGAVIGLIIEIPVQEIWGLPKSHLSESNESGDDTLSKLMKKIKDLPLEKILEEIRKISQGYFYERSHRAFYHTGVSPETPTFGVRVFASYGISTTNLILTLRNCGLNKRMHFIRSL